jgi:alkanesulfonate monooxygenase SsuD/methylene tetrahydromethanopterin reductase-like flavin-dependent oxidoreductase (luciferase family)
VRFGLFIMGTRNGSYDAMLDQARRAEELGFATVVLAERHFRHADLLYPSPLGIGAAIAARTERIRIGTAGRILSLDHPIHVAEAAATLDVLSDGRLDFGATRASLDEEAHLAFDSPPEESETRFREALAVIEAAWGEDEFSFTGEHFRIPEVSVFPKPVQRPRPPIYLVAVSPRRLAYAARNGYSAYIGAIRSVPELAETAESYWDGLVAAGHDRHGASLAVNRFCYVSDDDARARAEIEAPFMELMGERAPDLKAALIAKYGGAAELSFERFLEDFGVFGAPDTVAARLRDVLAATRTDYLLATVNFVTLDHDLCMRSMELFASEVMPRLNGAARTPGTGGERSPVAEPAPAADSAR